MADDTADDAWFPSPEAAFAPNVELYTLDAVFNASFSFSAMLCLSVGGVHGECPCLSILFPPVLVLKNFLYILSFDLDLVPFCGDSKLDEDDDLLEDGLSVCMLSLLLNKSHD